MYHTCYDLPVVYESIPGYFDKETREQSTLTGSGGGRKQSKGAPRDFEVDVHYFKSRVRALRFLEKNRTSHVTEFKHQSSRQR